MFVVGDGPSGTGFYRLSDVDKNGQAEQVETLLKFKGSMGEHGPHAPVLGPDGLIYIMIGNHSFVEAPLRDTSPHHHFYEGELFSPKYEDANGHAAGIKAPGGSVIRTDTNGSFVELFLGGFRNAYDHAFNRDGELFTYDSDMEWDVALPWYRPTRVNHLIPGAEFGWRSGWSKWPNYFVDSLPETLDIGRGSPTGVVFYDHSRLGPKYDGALFMCDWSQGRVVAVTTEPADGTYRAKSEVFLEGRPLNCSDIDVGPDGWLYIAVGGRNTAGSIFRVVAKDAKPLASGAGDGRAAGHPATATHQRLGPPRRGRRETTTGRPVGARFAGRGRQSRATRGRARAALDLMQLFGPVPANELLVQFRATRVPGAHEGCVLAGHPRHGRLQSRLVELLDDADPNVRAMPARRWSAPARRAGQQTAGDHGRAASVCVLGSPASFGTGSPGPVAGSRARIE